MARSYVDSILDAAAMASRQDTLGDMLNQLPGLLVEQQRYRDQQQKEAERYADEKSFRNTQYNDMVDSRNFSEDVAMVDILADLEGDEAVAYGDNISYKTDRGRNLGNAVRKSKGVTVANNNEINTKFKNLSENFGNLTVEEAEIQLSEFRLELESKGIKRDTSTFDKKLAVKKNREFANDVLDIVDFENEDELRNIISGSNNPTQIATFMIDRLDKDKLDSIENKKDKNKLMIDLGNVISSLRNSDAPESVIKKYENKLALLSASSMEGEPVESDGTLTEAELEAFKSKGQSGIITVPNNDDNRLEKNIEINLDTGEFKYVDESSVNKTSQTESRKEKTKRLRENKRNAKTKKEFDKADKELKEFLSKPDVGIDRTYGEEQAMITREEQTRLVPSSFNI
jgi:tRNA-binding EMAP/Myf-like protein|tara:strand:- start:13923 stop:15122 length:1200 start_codon:yes stop_codon:yes gene_type:complete